MNGDSDEAQAGSALKRSPLEAAGWVQFSFVSPADHHRILAGTGPGIPPDNRLLVISHTCDLSQPASEEPNVEVLPIAPIDEKAANLLAGRSPRVFQFRAWRTGDRRHQTFSTHARSSFRVSKATFEAGLLPDPDWSLRDPYTLPSQRSPSAGTLARWLARRFDRPDMPFALTKRLNQIRSKIAKRLHALGELGVHEVLMQFQPNEELLDDQPYQVWLVVIVPRDRIDNRKGIDNEVTLLLRALTTGGRIVVPSHTVEDGWQLRYAQSAGMWPIDAAFI